MFKSIAEQTGNYSYSLNLSIENFSPFEFGFSGNNKIFGFSGQSGKLYDNDGNFVYSYSPSKSFSISGNRFENTNNYFINNIYINDGNSQNTGNTKGFYATENINYSLKFNGSPPVFEIGSGIFFNGDVTGLIDITNLGDTSFEIFSGTFVGPSGQKFSFIPPFNSGDVEGFRSFNISSTFSNGSNAVYSVPVKLHTNFGEVEQNISLVSLYQFIAQLSLNGGSEIESTGFYNYNLSYNLSSGNTPSTEPFNVKLNLEKIRQYFQPRPISPLTRYEKEYFKETGIEGARSEYINDIIIVEGAGNSEATGIYYRALSGVEYLFDQGFPYYSENGTSSQNQKSIRVFDFTDEKGNVLPSIAISSGLPSVRLQWYHKPIEETDLSQDRDNFGRQIFFNLEGKDFFTGNVLGSPTVYSGEGPIPIVRRAKWSEFGSGIPDFEINTTGKLVESGILSSQYSISSTGWNPYLNTISNGVSTGTFYSENLYATGNFSVPYTIQATGMVTGTTFASVGSITGGYNFEENKDLLFTGQEFSFASHTTGIEFTGVFENSLFTRERVVTVNSQPTIGVASQDTDVNYEWNALSSGFGSGVITNNVEVPLKDLYDQDFFVGFTGYLDPGAYIVTGSEFITITGLTGLSSYGQSFNIPFSWAIDNTTYTNKTTGFLNVEGEEIVTGQEDLTGIISFDANYSSTGFTGYTFEYNYLSHSLPSQNISGFFKNESVEISTSNLFGSIRPFAPLTGSYVGSGIFRHSFSSKSFPSFIYSKEEMAFVQTTGRAFFYGDFSPENEGTGIYIGNCYGNNYTGIGVGGFSELYNVFIESGERIMSPIKEKFFTGSEPKSPFDYFENNFSGNYIPLTGKFHDNIYNALEISGSSGIAVVPYVTDIFLNTGAFVYGSVGGKIPQFTKSPLFLKTDFLNSGTNNQARLLLSISAFYLSGNRAYKDTNWNSEIIYYSGDTTTGKVALYEKRTLPSFNTPFLPSFDFPSTNLRDAKEGYIHASLTKPNNHPNSISNSGFYIIQWTSESSKPKDATMVTISDNKNYKQLPSNKFLITEKNPNPKAILSFRKTNHNYFGDCIKVKRSSDSQTKEIPFFENFINISEIESFCGSSTGYLDAWYDQSLNDYHVYLTGSNAPVVWDGEIFKTGAIFQNTSLLRSSQNFGLSNSDNLSTIISANLYSQRQYSTIWSQAGRNTFGRRLAMSVPSAYSGIATDVWGPRGSVVSGHKIDLNQNYVFGIHHRTYQETITGGAYFWVDGQNYPSSGYNGTASLDLQDGALWVGGFTNLSNGYWDGQIQEIIIYDSNITGEFESIGKDALKYWSGVNSRFEGVVLSDNFRWPTGEINSGNFISNSRTINTGYNSITTGVTISGVGRVENYPYVETNSFYIENEFTGISPTGHYYKSTGSFSLEFDTGIFNTEPSQRLRLFVQANQTRLESGVSSSDFSDYFRIAEYIFPNFDSVESLKNNIQKDLPFHNVFISGGKIICAEEKGYQGSRVAFNVGFALTGSPLYENFGIQNLANLISGQIFFGSGFVSANNFESTETGITGQKDLMGITGEEISRDNIPAKIFVPENEIYGSNALITSSFTGLVPSTGLFQSNGLTTISNGSQFNQISSPFGPTNFSGNPNNIQSRLMNLGLNVSGYNPILDNNWSGFQNTKVYWTGILNDDMLFSGVRVLPSSFLDFTGTYSGIGSITGLKNITISDGSGMYQFNEQVLGQPNAASAIISRIGVVISGAVPVGDFTGHLSSTFTGTGIYNKDYFINLEGSGLNFMAPSYKKTFTGEYNLYSGVDLNNLFKIEDFYLTPLQDRYSNNYDKYFAEFSITGNGQIFFQIEQKKRFPDHPDLLSLNYSGIENTGSIVING